MFVGCAKRACAAPSSGIRLAIIMPRIVVMPLWYTSTVDISNCSKHCKVVRWDNIAIDIKYMRAYLLRLLMHLRIYQATMKEVYMQVTF